MVLLCALLNTSLAQCIRPTKYPIGNSGFFAYFTSQPDNVDISTLDTGDIIFTTQATCGNVQTGIVCVKFGTDQADDAEVLQTQLENYIDIVKNMVGITESAGYGRGHIHPEDKSAYGIIDYCTDANSNNWAFKAWINTKAAAVLYFMYPPSAENQAQTSTNIQQLFLDGFRFK
jgi:hypothetical protein